MKWFIIFILICIIIIGAVTFAPYYLTRADKPVKSDAVVLLIGSRVAPRREEVLRLIEDGYTRYIIIPSYGKIADTGLFSNQTTQTSQKPDPSLVRGRFIDISGYPKHYEDTHVEILEAKKMMDRAGFKSAIFVSSPYHMRRVSIIANTVFKGNGYRLTFVPSRYEQLNGPLWFLKKWDFDFVTKEYSKIIWFMLYRYFPTTVEKYFAKNQLKPKRKGAE